MSDITVLVVDDDVILLRTMQRILSSTYDVMTARTPDEALTVASKSPPDIAILDVHLNSGDSFVLMAQLRERIQNLFVIFMTGVKENLDEQHIRAIRERAFYFIVKPFEREVLLTLVQRCSEARQLSEANRYHAMRLESELQEARDLQRSLLPQTIEDLPGIAFAAESRPHGQLGGDFYDAVPAGECLSSVIIADVAGHGASAAMLTALLKSCISDTRAMHYDPLSIVQRVSQAIRLFGLNRFITLIAVQIDSRRGELQYVNAAHPTAYLLESHTVAHRLEPTGTIISPALEGATWEKKSIRFKPNQRLVMFSDGITELLRDAAPEKPEAIREILEQIDSCGQELIDEVFKEIQIRTISIPPTDDQTVVCVTVKQ